MNIIRFAIALGWVAALFYGLYVGNYELPAILILVAFFVYFMSLRNWGEADTPTNPLNFLRQPSSSAIKELAKGLASLIGSLLVGLGIGMNIPEVQLGVAFALCIVVIGVVAFVLFLIRALSACA